MSKIKYILKVLLFSAFLIFIGFLSSQSLGLAGGGFDSDTVLQQRAFYIENGLFLIGILFLAIFELFVKKDDKKFGDSIGFVSQGEYPSWSIFKNFSMMQLFLFFTIIFSSIGIWAVWTNQETFTGLRFLSHQFTTFGSISYSALLIPIAENLGAAFVIALMFFGLRYFGRKYNWSSRDFSILCYILIPLSVLIYWVGNHLLRYGSSSTSLWVIAGFGLIGGILTVLTGSFIPFWVMHQDNNLFFDLKRYYSNDLILIGTIISLIFLTLFYVYFYIFRKKKIKDEGLGM